MIKWYINNIIQKLRRIEEKIISEKNDTHKINFSVATSHVPGSLLKLCRALKLVTVLSSDVVQSINAVWCYNITSLLFQVIPDLFIALSVK